MVSLSPIWGVQWRNARTVRREEGAAMVEFAIIAPLLFALIFAIVDFGRALFLVNNLTSAVREGARFAAVQQDPTTAASQAAVQARVSAYIQNFGGANPPTQPTITLNQVAGQTYSITVTLTGYPFTSITPLGPVLGLLGGGPAFGGISMPTISAVFRWEGAVN